MTNIKPPPNTITCIMYVDINMLVLIEVLYYAVLLQSTGAVLLIYIVDCLLHNSVINHALSTIQNATQCGLFCARTLASNS